ncbi:hypothetical protein [Ponticaulis sp.]|uniref:hypothetical protein n=1 Tax=Ponticaulis sp. TaxID=2020902 RepID=UPI000B6DE7C9|nr:hypothetical protein [Ponticaulis sp.]MAI90353.1 hypothetical protein [Ponticaulis sp.]OUX99989.1 MAG: hypothetical protein CBB65_07930 [Hyphomonadaceae bacterium TMED5]|tara:strand:- start:327600 stop:328022 length:423 start_codon:yes stop_codon:yes gene_type:complete
MKSLIRFIIIAIGLSALALSPIYVSYEQHEVRGDFVSLASGACAALLIILISVLEPTFKRTLVTSVMVSLFTLPTIALLALYIRGPMMGITEPQSTPVVHSAVVFFTGILLLQVFGFSVHLKSLVRFLKKSFTIGQPQAV